MSRWMSKVFAQLVFLLLSLLAVHPLGAEEQIEETSSSTSIVEELGDQRYRIGFIEVDASLQRFTVPGRILGEEPPLRFFAVAGGGFKGFESLAELDANAYDFNTACTLLSLAPNIGDLVDIWVSWEVEGNTTTVDAADLVRLGENTLPHVGWVYTGPTNTPDGELHAYLDGTLIGFTQDPASVIEHLSGFGMDDPGAVEPNLSLLPPAGTPVTLTVERRGK